MPLRTGPVTIVRLRGLGDFCRSAEEYAAAIEVHHFVPIDVEGREETSSGWAHLPDSDRYREDVAGWSALSLRTDTLKPTAAQVRKVLHEKRREIEAAEKMPMSASRLRDLKDMVKLGLRKRVFARTQLVDVLFDDESRDVLLLGGSKKTRELLQVLWEYTFGVQIDVETAGSLAVRLRGEDVISKLGREPAFILDRTLRDEESVIAEPEDEPEDEETLSDAIHDDEDGDDEGDEDEAPLTDYRFLGREFLTWLACQLSDSDGPPLLEGWTLSLGEHARLSAFTESGVREVTARSMNLAEMSDLRFAVGGGLLPRELALMAERNDRLWMFTLLAEGLAVKGAKLPSVLSTEDDDAAEERAANLLDMNEMVTQLYDVFLQRRTDPAVWAVDVALVQEWVRDAVRRP